MPYVESEIRRQVVLNRLENRMPFFFEHCESEYSAQVTLKNPPTIGEGEENKTKVEFPEGKQVLRATPSINELG